MNATTAARVIEVVDGVPIVARAPRDPLAMEPGNRGRFEPDGPVYVVDRVTDCAAYVHRVYDPPLVREIGRAALDDATEELLLAIDHADAARLYELARIAGHAGRGYRRIAVSQGPFEPGIARGARFVETT